MKADYKNWMPRGLIYGNAGVSSVFLAVGLLCRKKKESRALRLLSSLSFVGAGVGLLSSAYLLMLYRIFSYKGKRKLAKHIIDGVAAQIKIPAGGRGLDVGCGSGALTIAAAKRNPEASFVGADRWGREYASFSQKLCEDNARAEGVKNVHFLRADARELPFPDESFDLVTSNYVYHNIPGDRQALLRESLRVLKKGGRFVIHDIFYPSAYGDMQAFLKSLHDEGYAEVRLIPTADGLFVKKCEAKWMMIADSALLMGIK